MRNDKLIPQRHHYHDKMDRIDNYCPLVGDCRHVGAEVKRNSYFLIQPFDREKANREKAIERALSRYHHGENNYELRKSDKRIYDVSIYCEICLKIRSSECCIVDISGEMYNVIDEKSGKTKSEIFLRPNVALELGMAYGLNKPAIILSRAFNGKRKIPSDIEFIRYVDIPFRGWSSASQKLLDHLRERTNIRSINESIDIDYRKRIDAFKKYCKKMLQLKRASYLIKNKDLKIKLVKCHRGELIGIIQDASNLINDTFLMLYVLEGEIEELKAILQVYHVQSNGHAQVKFCEMYDKKYTDDVIERVMKTGSFVLGQHRLELIVPEDLNNIIEEMGLIIEWIDRTC